MAAVPAVAAPTPAPAEAGVAPRVGLRRTTIPVAPIPGEARLDGLGPAAHTVHDAVQVPKAGRAAIAAPAAVAPTRQVTTRPMGRLVRMQGGPTTATAIMAARRRTSPREAPGIGLLGTRIAEATAVAKGQATPVEDLGLVVGPTAETTTPNTLRKVRSPGPSPSSGLPQVGPTVLTRKGVPAAGTTLTTGGLRTTPTGRAARAPGAGGTAPRRGVVTPSPTHGMGPTPIGAIRVALVVGGLRRGTVAVATPMVPERRPIGVAGETPIRRVATGPTSPAARPSRREPLVPIMVPKEPMAQDRQAT